jgi:hypothetical protein
VIGRNSERSEVEGIHHPGSQIIFGRSSSADYRLTRDDLHVSRHQAALIQIDGIWWLKNVGSRLEITVHQGPGNAIALLPDTETPILTDQAEFVVAGAVRHVVHLALIQQGSIDTDLQIAHSANSPETESLVESPLTDVEHLALVAVASGYLESEPRRHMHPRSYAEAATLAGMKTAGLRKAFERVQDKFFNVPGMDADDKKRVVCEYAVRHQYVTRADLQSLPGRAFPR